MQRTESHQMNYEIIQVNGCYPLTNQKHEHKEIDQLESRHLLGHALHYKCIGSRVCYCMQVTMTLECLLLFVFLFTVLMSHSLSWMIICHKDSTENLKI